jgi:hypothetical protein
MIAGGEKATTQARRWFCGGDTSTWLFTQADATVKIKGGLTTDTYQTVVDFEDVTLFFPYDGVTKPYKYDYSADDNTAVSDIELTQPDVSSSLAATNGEGVITGIVKYFIAFISGTDQLALSEAFGEIDAGEGSTIDLSALPTSAGQGRYIFRTMAGGAQPFFAGAISSSDDTVTTWTDEVDDTELTFVPKQHGSPPPLGTKYAVVYNNRVWCAGETPHEVIFSDLNEPQSYNTYSFFSISGKDGDEITGLATMKDRIIVFKNNHIYKIVGQDPEAQEMPVSPVRSSDPKHRSIGCPDQGALCTTPNGIFFYYNNNFYMMSNQCQIRTLASHFEDELRADVNQARQERIRCWYDPNRRLVYASVPTGSEDYPTRTYLYFLDFDAWYKMTPGFTAGTVVEIGDDGQPPDSFQIWAHYNETVPIHEVQRLDHPTATDFDGDAIVAQAVLPPLYLVSPMDVTMWTRGKISFDVADTSTNLQLRYNTWSGSGADVQLNVPLQEDNVTKWFRRYAIGLASNELKLNIYWPGGTKRPVVHRIVQRGMPEGSEIMP